VIREDDDNICRSGTKCPKIAGMTTWITAFWIVAAYFAVRSALATFGREMETDSGRLLMMICLAIITVCVIAQ